MKRKLLLILTAVLLALFPKANFGQAPNLGAASSFALFTSVGAFSNLGLSVVKGDIGTNAGPLSGFPPGTLDGAIYLAGDPTALQASTDLGLAYAHLSTLGGAVLGVGMGGGQTITPGIYATGAASTINGDLTFDGQGDPNALFIIRIGGALATGNASNILLTGGASLSNIYWQVNGQFDLGDFSIFRGTLIANGAINLLEGSTLLGRGLSIAGAIGLHNNIVQVGLPPVADAGLDKAICFGSSTQIGTAAVPGHTYSWTSVPAGYNSTEANPTVSPTVTTTYTVVETITATALSDSDNAVVTVNPLPAAPDITLVQPTCLSATGTITVTAPTGAGMTYSIDGVTYTNSTGIFGPLVAGPYTVTDKNAAGCISLGTIVTINAQPATPPAPAITLTQTSCLSATGTITVTAPTEAGMTYSIDGVTYTNTTGIFGSLDAGPYTVTDKNLAGCISLGTAVTINAQPATPPAPTLTLTQTSCISTTGTITVTAPTGAGMTYSIDGVTYTNTTGAFPLLAAGPYNVTAKNSDGCISPVTIGTINAQPTVPTAYAGADATICETGTFTLSGSSLTGVGTILWTTSGNGTFDNATTLHPVYTPGAGDVLQGSVLLTLTMTPAAPCFVSSDPLVLLVPHRATVNAGIDAIVWAGATYTVSTASSQYAASILWTHNGTGILTNATTLTPTYTPGTGENGTVTLTATAVSASPCASASDQMTISVNPGSRAGIIITKSPVETSFSAVGDIVHYSISLLNTSNQPIYTITVTDPNGLITSASTFTVLNPGSTATVLANHVITQQDIDAGFVTNCAFATGSFSDGSAIAISTNCNTLNGLQRPQVTITKFSSESTFHTLGEVIHYSFEIFNCGSVTVSNLVVSDPKAVILTGSPISSLAPRHTVTATGEHVVTQADLDAGKIANIAIVAGTDPIGNPVRDDSNEITIYSNEPSRLVVAKFATEASFNAKGDTIHYEIWVKNFRTTTMADIIVSDPNATITSGGNIFRLASGKTSIAYAYHVVNQQDLDAGKVVNTAFAKGKDYYDFLDEATSNEVTVFALQSPILVLIKTAEETSFRNVGDLIHYNNEVRNTGNVKITDLTLSDPNTHFSGSNQITALNPGQSVVIKTTQVITQADLNLGLVEKAASIRGYDANTQSMQRSSNRITITGIQDTRLTTAITSAESSFSLVGDLIHYSIEIRNTGNVTVTKLHISDAVTGFSQENAISEMVPGAVFAVAVEQKVSQSDLRAGKVVNMASVTGFTPKGEKLSNQSNPLTIMANKAERLTVTKIALESGYTRADQVIHYAITVKNNGMVPMSGISVNSPNELISGNPVIASLAANASTTIPASYKVTQTDVDAGRIITIATITGIYPDGSDYTETSNPVNLYGYQQPYISANISASEDSFTGAGQKINYSIDILNSGNVTLTGIGLAGQNNLVFSGGRDISLAPGESTSLSAQYVITVADMDAGKAINAVNVTGTGPDNQVISITSGQLTVNGVQKPQLSASASAIERTFSKAGETIHYTILVKNSGNVSLISTAVTDPNAVIITARPNTILLPGESFIVSASHLITQEDVEAGKVTCSAKAVGFDLKGNTIEKVGNKVTVHAALANEEVAETSDSNPDFKKTGTPVTDSPVIVNFNLSNFPNPFSYETTITFDLPEKGKVTLKVYDITGREIGKIDQEDFNQGRNYVIWNSKSTQKGLYILKMVHNGIQANRMISIVN
ncbi:MAG: ice-binding family protein [Bacteroidales bacterium]|jgi:uncharacterized repeat protein (TIGR01451 family)